jgi:hypothetical protein
MVSKSTYKRMVKIIERAAKESCCLCRDKCLSCDAQDLLKELSLITL